MLKREIKLKQLLFSIVLLFSLKAQAETLELFSARYYSNTDFSSRAKFVVNIAESKAWVDLWYRYFDGIRHHSDFKTIEVDGLKVNLANDAITYNGEQGEVVCADITKRARKYIIVPTGLCEFVTEIESKFDYNCGHCFYYTVKMKVQ